MLTILLGFGSVASVSRSPSDTSDSSSSSEAVFCRGVPGKSVCGIQFLHGDKAVQCDLCKAWLHTKCQAISKPANDALVKFKCLSWLCVSCTKKLAVIEGGPAPRTVMSAELKQLETKVQDISDTVQGHMKIIVQSLKEQEKVIGDNTKLLEILP